MSRNDKNKTFFQTNFWHNKLFQRETSPSNNIPKLKFFQTKHLCVWSNLWKTTLYALVESVIRILSLGDILLGKILQCHIFEHINEPQLGLSWKTKIYRPEDLRLGPFSIHPFSHLWDKQFNILQKLCFFARIKSSNTTK